MTNHGNTHAQPENDVNSVKVNKGSMNGSSAIDTVITHELKDLAETVSQINQHQLLRLDLVETESVSNVFPFSSPKETRRSRKYYFLLLDLSGIPQTFISKYQGQSNLCSPFCSLCTSVSTHHASTYSVSSAGCSQSSNSPIMHAPVSTPSPLPHSCESP